MAVQRCRGKADTDCIYKFTDHLHHNPPCNPFPGGVMWLECTVEVPLEAAVGWFLNGQQLQNDSRVVIMSETQLESSINSIMSQLTINDITFLI